MTIDFFYSDPHFNHTAILRHCPNRAFDTIEEMNEVFIERYNERVRQQDSVLWLGDCFFGRVADFETIMDRLNGSKMLIRGNHDGPASRMARLGFDLVMDWGQMQIGGERVRLFHHPYRGIPEDNRVIPDRRMQEKENGRDGWWWPERRKGEWLIHGHTHATTKWREHRVHVGVDAWDFAPAPFEEVAMIIDDVSNGRFLRKGL
jgi:calcineurin-like phosphoesterase family protein